METERKQIIDDINTMYRAAFSAICHCNSSSADGAYPSACPCDKTKKTHDAIAMLVEVRKKILRKYGS